MKNIGGQALIEGLLMIGPRNTAIAIRKKNNEIVIKKEPLSKPSTLSKIPFIRGSVNMISQMIIGVKALLYSADCVEYEDEQDIKPSKLDKFLNENLKDLTIYLTVLLSLCFSVGLFILLPNFIAGLFNFNQASNVGTILYNLIEGVIRIVLFMTYIILTSKLDDMKRIWEYHGAEHKTLHCYEHSEELTIENVKKYSTKHPRCGTSFLFTIMIISILVFSLTGWHNVVLNILIRLAMIPVIAGISYELIKYSAKHDNRFTRFIIVPGLWFQNYTTKEPDNTQIEVAIEALINVLPNEGKDLKAC